MPETNCVYVVYGFDRNNDLTWFVGHGIKWTVLVLIGVGFSL